MNLYKINRFAYVLVIHQSKIKVNKFEEKKKWHISDSLINIKIALVVRVKYPLQFTSTINMVIIQKTPKQLSRLYAHRASLV